MFDICLLFPLLPFCGGGEPPATPPWTATPAVIRAGEAVRGQSAKAVWTLENPRDGEADVAISLSSANPAVSFTPASVTLAAGGSADVDVAAACGGAGPRSAKLAAESGARRIEATLEWSCRASPANWAFSRKTPTSKGAPGTPAATVWTVRNPRNGLDGVDVALSSDSPSVSFAPASVTLAAGQSADVSISGSCARPGVHRAKVALASDGRRVEANFGWSCRWSWIMDRRSRAADGSASAAAKGSFAVRNPAHGPASVDIAFSSAREGVSVSPASLTLARGEAVRVSYQAPCARTGGDSAVIDALGTDGQELVLRAEWGCRDDVAIEGWTLYQVPPVHQGHGAGGRELPPYWHQDAIVPLVRGKHGAFAVTARHGFPEIPAISGHVLGTDGIERPMRFDPERTPPLEKTPDPESGEHRTELVLMMQDEAQIHPGATARIRLEPPAPAWDPDPGNNAASVALSEDAFFTPPVLWPILHVIPISFWDAETGAGQTDRAVGPLSNPWMQIDAIFPFGPDWLREDVRVQETFHVRDDCSGHDERDCIEWLRSDLAALLTEREYDGLLAEVIRRRLHTGEKDPHGHDVAGRHHAAALIPGIPQFMKDAIYNDSDLGSHYGGGGFATILTGVLTAYAAAMKDRNGLIVSSESLPHELGHVMGLSHPASPGHCSRRYRSDTLNPYNVLHPTDTLGRLSYWHPRDDYNRLHGDYGKPWTAEEVDAFVERHSLAGFRPDLYDERREAADRRLPDLSRNSLWRPPLDREDLELGDINGWKDLLGFCASAPCFVDGRGSSDVMSYCGEPYMGKFQPLSDYHYRSVLEMGRLWHQEGRLRWGGERT